MKKTKIAFWTSSILIFLFEGVMPAMYGNTEMAKEGIRQLGYPDYFGALLGYCKIAGAILLIIPRLPKRLKEWVYAGFTFNFLFAFASNLIIHGFSVAWFPLLPLAILAVSYFSYHRLNRGANSPGNFQPETIGETKLAH